MNETSNSILKNIRVILLDRDGVINEEPGPILSPEHFVMIPKSASAVARAVSYTHLRAHETDS